MYVEWKSVLYSTHVYTDHEVIKRFKARQPVTPLSLCTPAQGSKRYYRNVPTAYIIVLSILSVPHHVTLLLLFRSQHVSRSDTAERNVYGAQESSRSDGLPDCPLLGPFSE